MLEPWSTQVGATLTPNRAQDTSLELPEIKAVTMTKPIKTTLGGAQYKDIRDLQPLGIVLLLSTLPAKGVPGPALNLPFPAPRELPGLPSTAGSYSSPHAASGSSESGPLYLSRPIPVLSSGRTEPCACWMLHGRRGGG